MTRLRRGDVVLVTFPFVAGEELRRKRRPAVVVQANRYNRRRNAVIIAAITSSRRARTLASKVTVASDSPEGRQAGLRTDSIVDCQTLATVPRELILQRLGEFPSAIMELIDGALQDSLGLFHGTKTTA